MNIPQGWNCPKCGAPCTRTVNMRGGDHGWSTTDEERAEYKYAAPEPTEIDPGEALYQAERAFIAAATAAAPEPPAPGVDLCEVARELERVHAEKAIAEAAEAVAGRFTLAYRCGFLQACEEIAARIGVPYADPAGESFATPAPPASGGVVSEGMKADMFWDDDDPEMATDSIHEIMVRKMDYDGIKPGDTFKVQRACSLGVAVCRVVLIPATEDSDEDYDYEYLSDQEAAALAAQGDEGKDDA